MDKDEAIGVRTAERAAVASKDEQISLLKAVLIQLNDELEKKDERISELETQLLQVLNHQDSVTMTTQSVCPHCTSCQNSSVVTKEIISSPMTTANSSINSDHITAPRSLSPINEGTDDKINPRQVGGASVRSGNHSNNTTPRRKISSSVLDREQQELQRSIASLDSTIAELELKGAGKTEHTRLVALRRERSSLMSDLNRKVQQRLKKIRRNSDDVFTRLATEYENCTRDQMCAAVRELDRAQANYKAYIDQLLVVVLETNPALLEGMPRLQQGRGLRMDLIRMASRGELFEDIQERERNVASLELYASLLAERIMKHAPPLLPALDPFQDTDGMEQDTTQHQAEPMTS